jgi:acetyltransferase-like isoleucine patch superfamily enzyme
MRPFASHGSGTFQPSDFAAIGSNVVFEPGVLVFHPDHIRIGSNVYVGHNAILKGYYKNEMIIGNDVWIGQQCFFHSAGGLRIGDGVGIGPSVRILTSEHREMGRGVAILESQIECAPVTLDDACDVGVGAIILPGVRIGRGARIGAGAVVTRDVPDFAVAAGVPARVLRMRPA